MLVTGKRQNTCLKQGRHLWVGRDFSSIGVTVCFGSQNRLCFRIPGEREEEDSWWKLFNALLSFRRMWSLTGFAITAFASESDQLPLASDCLGNGEQRMVLNRDVFCDCTALILLGVSLSVSVWTPSCSLRDSPDFSVFLCHLELWLTVNTN